MKGASALSDDTAASASLDHLEAQAAPTQPRAQPEHLGSSPRPQELASGRPKVEDFPLSTNRRRRRDESDDESEESEDSEERRRRRRRQQEKEKERRRRRESDDDSDDAGQSEEEKPRGKAKGRRDDSRSDSE